MIHLLLFLIGVMLGILSTSVIFIAVFESKEKEFKIKAVEQGHAVWKVDKTGATEFQWK